MQGQTTDPYAAPAATDEWWKSTAFATPSAPKASAASDPFKFPATSASVIQQLEGKSASATTLAGDLGKQGNALLDPASDYLKAILSGDRQETLQATMPERRRVIDQYSAAKKAIAEFSPRSGGQAGAGLKLQAQEASDLAGIVPQARQSAVQQAVSAGTALQGLGLSAESLASGDLSAVLQALTAKDANGVDWAAIGSAAAQIAMYAAAA